MIFISQFIGELSSLQALLIDKLASVELISNVLHILQASISQEKAFRPKTECNSLIIKSVSILDPCYHFTR